jgi:hypothetical protein
MERGQAKVNIEELMRDFVRASVALKRKPYLTDEGAATTAEGVEGERIKVHFCKVCNQAAAGKGAQVRHAPGCVLDRLQRAHRALYASWPELFAEKPEPEEKAAPHVRHAREEATDTARIARPVRRSSMSARVAVEAARPPQAENRQANGGLR